MGMTTLLGLVAACTDPISVSPTFDPETNQVLTQFVINIAPADKNVNTKQSSSAVQKDSTFRGLGNASLFTFSLPQDGRRIIDPFADSAQRHPNDYIDLSDALRPNTLDPYQIMTDTTLNKSRRILDINLKTGTNAILFYGEGIIGQSNDQKNDYGRLVYTVDPNDMRVIGCWARPRLPLKEITDKGFETETPSAADAAYHKIERIIENTYNWMFKIGINGLQSSVSNIDKHYYAEGTTESPYVYGPYNIKDVPIHWSDYAQCDSRETDTPYSPLGRVINAAHSGESGYVPLSETEICAPYEELLGRAYNSFIKTDRGSTSDQEMKEFRAGSGASVARQMRDLFSIITDAMSADPTNEKEEIALLIMKQIYDYLTEIFITNQAEFAWRSPAEVIAGIKDRVGSNVIQPALTAPGGVYTIKDFPMHFDLPIGSTTMRKWTAVDSVKYHGDATYGNLKVGDFYYLSHLIDISGMAPPGTVDPVMTVHDYTYPPSLVYFGNSYLRVSDDNNLKVSDFPDGSSEWMTSSEWNNKWSIGHVTANTRGAAVFDNIQYGNAMLQTRVRYKNTVSTTGLYDNNQGINGDTENPNVFYPGDKEIEKDGYLSLTGIMIGGQPDKVGWNYLPVPNAKFDKMVYDKRINSADGYIDTTGLSTYSLVIPSSGDYTKPNYTLLFDNYQTPRAQTVYVALEFVNNLKDDFWGNANMVRKGGTFYLLGKLELTSDMIDAFCDGNPSKFDQASNIFPPYDNTGNPIKDKDHVRIFMQDFMTEATFVIDENSLKHAYVTVPDLRSSKMSFGLSVDLNWSKGLEFDDIVL